MNITQKFNLKGKVAIITGASKGIGLAIAQIFLENEAQVVISSRKQESLDQAVQQLSTIGEAYSVTCHMGNIDQISQLVNSTINKFGRVDIVVNNAATNPIFGSIQSAEESAFDKIMDVNVKGPWLLAKECYPHMVKARGGSIINISSIEGVTPGPGLGLYSVSKAALIQMSKVMAREWGSDQIRVNTICPGLVKTKFSEALTGNEHILKHILAKQALQEVAEPADIAGLALYLASDASKFSTGASYTIDGGFTI